MAEISQCRFCDTPQILKRDVGFPRHHLTEFGLPRLDVVSLIQTKNLAVFPDILPAEPNGLHFLVVPSNHGQAFAQRPDLADELGYVIARVEEEFGAPMIRGEHGGGSPEQGYGESKNQSVYHQHLHLAGNPEGRDVLEHMKDALTRKEKIHFKSLHGLDGTPSPIVAGRYTGHPYLFIQQGSEGIWAEDPGDTFPSQILQRNLSSLLSGEVLNWKKIDGNPDLARLSAQRLAKVFEQCKI